jgi:hypothetical protein
MTNLIPPSGGSDLGRDPEASRSMAAGQTQAENTGATTPMTSPTDPTFQEAHTIRPRPAPATQTGLRVNDPTS